MSILEEMLHKIDVELGVKEPSGHHITANDDQDFAGKQVGRKAER